MEQPDAAEGHRDVVLVAGVDDLLVADGAAGLDDGGHAGTAGALDVVAKREERIRTQRNTGDVAQILLLFLGGQRSGLLGEGLGPDIVADDIFGSAFWPARRVQWMRLCWPAPTPMVWPL